MSPFSFDGGPVGGPSSNFHSVATDLFSPQMSDGGMIGGPQTPGQGRQTPADNTHPATPQMDSLHPPTPCVVAPTDLHPSTPGMVDPMSHPPGTPNDPNRNPNTPGTPCPTASKDLQ